MNTPPRHSRLRQVIVVLVCGASLVAVARAGETKAVSYRVDTTKTVGDINIDIYGQFLEHIFNSVHGGLWGDMILNPSLEREPATATWLMKDGELQTLNRGKNTPLPFGDAKWADYEITMDAKVTGGNKSLNIPFRWQGPKDYYMLNFGVAGHRRWSLEKISRGGQSFPCQGDKKRPGVEVGKGYKVKIRAKGAHIQAWLDGEKIVDYVDKNKPFLHGKIGVSCVYSKPAYRNIVVRSLDGKVLFQGQPSARDMSITLPYWKRYGDGVLQVETAEPFNDRDSAVLTGTPGGETGIEQKPMMLRTGETYRLSLHLRSDSPNAKAVVRILDDKGKAVFLKTLGPLTAKWKKYETSFKSKANATAATLQIGVKGKKTIMVDMLSMFSDSAMACGGFRPDLLKMIADEKPANIRYPGGCFASQYRWKDGVGPHEKRTVHGHVIWGDRDSNQMGTDEFMDLCRRVKAEPIIPVSLGYGLQNALDWLEYCNGSIETKWGKRRAENGHPKPYNVKYWEIDNETWGMGAKKYAEHVKTFSKALRAKDPSIKIIACGGYGYDDGMGGSIGWNLDLIYAAATDFDYLSIHYYNGIAYNQDFVDDPTRYEKYIRDELGPMIAKSKNPKMLIYCSEYGMMNRGWRSGLYTGGILNGFERLNGLLTMACPAVWLQKVSKDKPNPRWGSCSIIFDHTTVFGAPMHVVLVLWRDVYQPKRLAVIGPAKPLNVVAATSLDGKTVTFKAVNTGKDAVTATVTLDGRVKIKTATMQQIAPGSTGAKNTLKNPNTIKPESAPVAVKGKTLKFTLPALAVGAVTVTLR
jgi:alpha-N-arabinofuranosidase